MGRLGRILGAATLVVALAAAATPGRADKASVIRAEAARLLNEGVAALNRGEYSVAIEKLRRCSSINLSSFQAHYYLGLALIGDRRYAAAVESLKVALDLDPAHAGANVAIGNAWLKRGDVDEATASFYRALELRQEYPPALDGIARTYEARVEDEKAVETYRRAIARDPGYAEAYTHLGDLYLRKGRVSEAVSLLSEAVRIRPDFGDGLDRLAAAYARIGFLNEAVATIQRAIQLEPRSAGHFVTLGSVHLEMGSSSAAEASFGKALELDPGLPGAREGMAEAARRRGDYAAALAQLDAALGDSRTDSASQKRIENLRGELERERADLERLEPLVESGEATPEDLTLLAATYARRGQWGRAAELQQGGRPEGIEKERLAYYLLRAGRYREAHVLYAELARVGGRYDLEVNDGVALAKLGDHEEAAAAFRRALSLDPKESRAKVYLANALLRLGRSSEAVEGYKSYLLGGATGETAERVRRILLQIAPETLADLPPPAPLPARTSSSGAQ